MRWLAILVVAIGCGPAKSNSTQPVAPPAQPATATIHWTSHRVPHIVAPDLETLALGQGYAMAKLHLCIVADQIVRVRGERARFFGPGPGDKHINSDFGVLNIGYRAAAEKSLTSASSETLAVLEGFAAGINLFVAKTDEHPRACRGAAWVRPISALDIATLGLFVNSLGATGVFVEEIGRATGPDSGAAAALPEPVGASNGWALGADRTGGGGILAGNPHFPWEGANKFYESHLIIPGRLDVYGASLIGAPMINLGFNRQAGWTHTFSASKRMAFFRLNLVDGKPTKYKFGSEERELTATSHTIEVLRDDGVEKMSRVLYRSHHGPIVAAQFTPWTRTTAFAIGDATWGKTNAIDQYLAMMRAQTTAEIDAAIAQHQGLAFVNTIAADSLGNAYYADSSQVPDLGRAGMAAFAIARKTVPAVMQAWQFGILGLDGSLPIFDFDGALSFEQAPRLTRRDFVMNANDPYGATNPASPLSGYSVFFGDPDAPLSARTEMNLKLLAEAASGWTADRVESALLSNRGYVAENERARVLKSCETPGDAAAACKVIEAWDGRLDPKSRGAVLWREALPLGLTPLKRLATAADRLSRAGIKLDARLDEVQFFEKGGKRFPVHGGISLEGTTNLARYSNFRTTLLPGMEPGESINSSSGLTTRGYPINYGTSFLFIVHFKPDSAPQARGILVYGNSSDPDDTEQLVLWGQKKLRPLLFELEAIKADPNHMTELVQR